MIPVSEAGREDIGEEDIGNVRLLYGCDGFAGDECPIQEDGSTGGKGFVEQSGISEDFFDRNSLFLGFSIVLDEDRCVIGMDEEGVERNDGMSFVVRGLDGEGDRDTRIRGRFGRLVPSEGVPDIEEPVFGLAFREE